MTFSSRQLSKVKIKIGYQSQARKPIFLLGNGNIICGNFRYRGRYVKKFKDYYYFILSHANTSPKNNVLNVSGVRYWDATSIYNDYMAPKWQRTIGLGRIGKMANETEIRRRIEDIKPEFTRVVGLKWKRVFRQSDPHNPDTPKMAWQIL